MSTLQSTRRLNRGTDGRAKAPVRIVHLGLGNFFRAHQAWYTEHAGDAASWGIAAFSGRSATGVEELNSQDDLYTLILQGAQTTSEVISSLSAVHAGNDLAALRRYFASPELSIVTSTVTEAGYVRNAAGGLDAENDAVKADIAALQADPAAGIVSTAPGKFVAGLLARRAAGAGAITFVPCDNVVDNGPMTRRVVRELAQAVDASLVPWIDANCGFVTTMVDRITPRPTDADKESLAASTGIEDPAAIVTEPFTEWVLSGEFRSPRPRWEDAGANFVDDIVPFEHRKLWLLNGSHSLLAYAGTIKGKQTVLEGISDATLRGWVNEWWDIAAAHLPLPAQAVQDYRDALIARFENPSIRHLLAQIAADGSQKIPIRIVPALKAERAAGRMPYGATRVVAAWIDHLRGAGAPVNDARSGDVLPLVAGSLEDSVARVVAWLGVDDAEVNAVVARQAAELLA